MVETTYFIIWQWYMSSKRMGTIQSGLLDMYGFRICSTQAMRCSSIHAFFDRCKIHLQKQCWTPTQFGLPVFPWRLKMVGAFCQKLWSSQQVLHVSYFHLTCEYQPCRCHSYLFFISHENKMGLEFDPYLGSNHGACLSQWVFVWCPTQNWMPTNDFQWGVFVTLSFLTDREKSTASPSMKWPLLCSLH